MNVWMQQKAMYPNVAAAYIGVAQVIQFVALVVCQLDARVFGQKEVEVVTMGLVTNATTFSLHYLGPALDLAAARFRTDHGQRFNLTHTYIIDPSLTICPELTSQTSFLVSEWYYKKRRKADVYAFILPMCTEFGELNRLLASWDILMITTAVDDPSLRNKLVTPTALTTAPTSFVSLLGMYVATLAHFNWTTVVIVHDQSANSGFFPITDQLMPLLRERGWQVYIVVSVFKSKALGDLTWKYGDEYDEIAREAFRSVMIVGPDASIYALSNWTTTKALSTGYVSALDRAYPAADPLLALISAAMEAFLVLGQVLEEALSDDDTAENFKGRNLAKRFLDRRYDLGFTEVTLDEFGQRLIHEELSDLDPVTGEFRAVLRMQFIRPKSVIKLANIDWAGPTNSSNAIPLSEPLCGFLDDRGPCAQRPSLLLKPPELGALLTVLGAALVCLCLAFPHYSKKSHLGILHYLIAVAELDFRKRTVSKMIAA
ncbi:hypothetical protein RvY_03982 [Ramazzottius varieornatus]|uniref:Receptor ligand binding region domain-containing protein n=1 Tax=Ramazzottius varieornatus TaxID=947166 RepID=A0A1D1UVM4_RAMVA|nr:hypothetical protein RvY_03982 [Ramazzottius varieornatus]